MNSLLTVLAVDDSEAYCYTVCKGLEANGFATFWAHNGTDALQLAARGKPDLIILDVNLPDVNGYEICRRLKADLSTRDIPVVFLSAIYKSNYAKDVGIAAGADAFLFAPIEPDQLAMVVRGSLARSASACQSQ